MTWLPLQENRNNLALRRRIVRRTAGTLFAMLSPIERWSDNNYSPQLLHYTREETPQVYRIVARLHGFEAQDVHVDLSFEHVIILLSSGGTAAPTGQQEYYCEALLPAGAKRNKALVEIGDEWLTVSLRKKQLNVFTHIVSEVARLGTRAGLT